MKLTNKMAAFATVSLTIGVSVTAAYADGFTDASSWVTFDPGKNGVGTDPVGFAGVVSDGRYIYFVPDQNTVGEFHGEVLRYDTQGDFFNSGSWDTFDYGETQQCVDDLNCTDPDGYSGAVFDGRYIYMAPINNGTEPHGEVLRYDTEGLFDNASSWATFDAGANGIGNDPDGYFGAVFDGNYVYFAPWFNGTDFHGEVLRYDTAGVFTDPSSWDTFDVTTNPVPGAAGAYNGAIFDGTRYIYFVPKDSPFHGEVLRFDTQGVFNDASSWTTYDYGDNCVSCCGGGCGEGECCDPDGYKGAVFDGQYVYFVPWFNGTDLHAEVLRYDTNGDFSSTTSWATYDAKANTPPGAAGGYAGAAFDGNRYIYFAPKGSFHGEVMRYDSQGVFNDVSSWATYDYGDSCVPCCGAGCGQDSCCNPDGYGGGVVVGRYVYFAPGSNGVFHHGEVLRYDTLAACCQTNADCSDANVCTQDQCIGGTCVNSGKTYGDVDNDGGIDLFDLFCILKCFENDFSICPFEKCDLEPCAGDADIDLFDLFAVINAFSGCDPCCSPQEGACCLSGGLCLRVNTMTECTDAGGSYQGVDTHCCPGACPP